VRVERESTVERLGRLLREQDAENERLRGALLAVADEEQTGSWPLAAQVARDALNGTEA